MDVEGAVDLGVLRLQLCVNATSVIMLLVIYLILELNMFKNKIDNYFKIYQYV